MEKLRYSPAEYSAVVQKYRENNDYQNMSEEEKEVFDKNLEKQLHSVVDIVDDAKDNSDCIKLREDIKKEYNYPSMTDVEKKEFDKKLDEIIGEESGDNEDDGIQEIGPKVLRKVR